MLKRSVAAFLAAVAILTLFPTISASAAGSAQPDRETTIKEKVTDSYTKFASSVYSSTSADNAVESLLYHSVYGHGKDLILNERSSVVSAIFNSGVFKESSIKAISTAITRMQELNEETILVTGGPGWHGYFHTYSYSGFLGDTKDYSKRLGSIATATKVGSQHQYTGPTNKNDDALELVVGGLYCKFLIRRTEVTGNSAVYTVEMKMYDDFDFNGDYASISKKGFSIKQDALLSILGGVLATFFIDPYYWEFSKTFQIEVPTFCDHSSGNYQWTYDAENKVLTSVTDQGFIENNTQKLEYTSTSSTTGVTTSYYHKLESPVILHHERPWVVEYDIQKLGSFALSPLASTDNCFSYLMQYSRLNTWVNSYEYWLLDPNGQATTKNIAYKYHYVGADTKDLFKYSSKRIYTFRLENVVAENGSNMIYLSIYDNYLQETVVESIPMDDYWYKDKGETERTLADTASKRIVGQDIIINYIGNKSYRLGPDYFKLTIWENGTDNTSVSGIISEYKAPTCTESGGLVHTCVKCGYEYVTEKVNATGHSYGEYVYDGNATCTADGTKTAACTTCGAKDTVIATGTALGHTEQTIPAVDATCTSTGLTEGKQCSRCSAVLTAQSEVPLKPHNEVTDPAKGATCTTTGLTEGKHCADCGAVTVFQNEVPAAGHDWSRSFVTLAPTMNREGVRTYTCVHCGDTKTEPVPMLEAPLFDDVPDDTWYTEAVYWAVANTITSGIGNHKFGPDMLCTRDQVVTFLWRAAGSPEPSLTENPFTDVSEDAWYYKAVLWAVENSITTGTSPDTFSPGTACDRAQVVTFLWRSQGSPASGTNETTFTDVPAEQWYTNAVLWATEKNITSGTSETTFEPTLSCTRSQIVTFLFRCMG